MPNRILKETICTSPEIEELSDAAEVLFYRLQIRADDHGRHDGRLNVMRALCFPIRPRITESKLSRQLVELMTTTEPLVKMYEVEGRPYLQITKWEKHQRVRAANSKFPPPSDGKPLTPADICPQMFANGARGHLAADVRPKRKRSTKSNAKADSDSMRAGGAQATASEAKANGRVSHDDEPPKTKPPAEIRGGAGLEHLSTDTRELLARTKAKLKR